MPNHLHCALQIPTPDDVINRPTTAILQGKSALPWVPPALVVDLSEDKIVPDLVSFKSVGIHATYAASYSQRYVFGFHHFHAILGTQGEFDCQEVENYRGRLKIHLANPPPSNYIIPDIQVRDDVYSVSYERLTARNVTRLNGYTFFGSPIEPANWGMWLLTGLQNAFSYVAAGQPGRYLCYAPEEWQKRLLKFMGVAPEKIVQQTPWATYYCEDLAVHQYSHIDLIPDIIARAIFQNVITRCRARADAPPRAEKLFVSRRSFTKKLGGKYRALVNEEQIEAAAAARGYLIIEPELLPFEHQVCLFNSARIVVGIGGAAMFNTVFCNPGTSIISMEGTAVFALNHARLFAAMGHRYGFIFGQQDSSEGRFPHNSWSVDVDAAMRAVESFA